ncbi:hypothetical protein F4054_23135 [Candidatus Poribacteria bacterium]|nr:hypothetical protein [Candidatus Poribacteria bacterium]MYG05721.1 hypothetical protein [Candidatus Poribacteria bacterium]MYK25146.1 hypothetical protein [Candidatus Poribacteria bacterium]
MQYDRNRFTIWTLRHPLILFWVLFPAAILNELILGQRIPKVMLTDKESDKPWMERTYVPCPHCETLNDQRLWAKWNALGHWFGFVCPRCHQVIPCLWNVWSLAVLAMTVPVWYFPARFLRRRWLAYEKKRLAKVLERPLIQVKAIHWLLLGIFCVGGLSWVLFEVWAVLYYGGEWDLKTMLESLPIWMVTGFGWGLSMHFFMNRKGRKGGRT